MMLLSRSAKSIPKYHGQNHLKPSIFTVFFGFAWHLSGLLRGFVRLGASNRVSETVICVNTAHVCPQLPLHVMLVFFEVLLCQTIF